MITKTPSPLQAGFWLTRQEQHYLLVICALSLFGIAARFYYLQHEQPDVFIPDGIEGSNQHGPVDKE